MGLYILTNHDDTEAVIVNTSCCPSMPLPFVFYDEYEPGIGDKVSDFLNWVRDIRGLVPWTESDDVWHKECERKWEEFKNL